MIDFNLINVSLQEWIVRSSGLLDSNVVFEDQSAPRPGKPYISLKPSSIVDIGQDDARTSVDSNGNSDFIGNREFTLSIKFYGDNALNTLSIIRDTLNDPTELQTLRDNGVVFVDQLLFTDVTTLLETIWEERGQLDILFRAVSISNYAVGLIERVGLNGKYIDASGQETINNDIIVTDPNAIAGTIISPLPASISMVSDSVIIPPPPSGFWDLANASYTGNSYNVETGGGVGKSASFHITEDGLNYYVTDQNTFSTHHFTMSVAHDITTSSYTGNSYSTSAQAPGGQPVGVVVSPDGVNMYIVHSNTGAAFQYTMSTPFDISTASYASKSFGFGGQDIIPSDLRFSPDGTRAYIIGRLAKTIYSYTMSTAWDLGTMSYDGVSFSVNAQDISSEGMFIGNSGSTLYMIGSTTDTAYQYSLPTPYSLTGATYQSASDFSVASEDTVPLSIFFNVAGDKMYMSGTFGNSFIYQYDIVI